MKNIRNLITSLILPWLLVACGGLAGSGELPQVTIRPANGETMSADVLDRVRLLPGVTAVEPYLVIQTDPRPVIGLEPGAPLRVLTATPVREGQIYKGQPFAEADRGQPVVIPGRAVAQEDFGMQGSMAGMRHAFDIGASFELNGTRVRVTGAYETESKVGQDALFMPLDSAQALFEQAGQVSVIFVTLTTDQTAAEAAQTTAEALGEDVVVAAVEGE